MKIRSLTRLLLSASLAWAGAGHAAVNVDRTRIIMAGNQKSVSVVLTNDSHDTPFLAQAWIENSAGETSNDLLALPPLQRMDAGKKAQVRILRASTATIAQLPQDRETLFYFNVREIPPAPVDTGGNTLQLTMQSRLKVFLRPTALAQAEGAAPERSLQVLAHGDTLTLKNPTPYYATVIWLGRDAQQRLAGFETVPLLAPFSEQEVKAALPAGASELFLGNVDDFGGLRMSRYRCTAGQCVFKERVGN